MNKLKRIFALAGAVILTGIYAATLIFALIDSPAASDLLKTSIAATILIPVLLYAFILVARLLKDHGGNDKDPDSSL